MTRRMTLHIMIGLLLVCSYGGSYTFLLQHHGDANRIDRFDSGIWNLPPVALLVIAGEFKGLVADYLTLEAGAQLGTQLMRAPEGGFKVAPMQYNWPSIHRLFVASQTLDPSFAQTYIVAQGHLPWEPANMVAEAQEILKIADRNRPWDWQPAQLMGFNSYYFLKQLGEAGKIYLQAAQKPNAPSYFSILGARLAQEGGETESAILIMRTMLADKKSEDLGYAEMANRLHALEGVLVIEQASKKYEYNFGKKPLNLEELVHPGILDALPLNPYHLEYCMDSVGNIYFDKPNCRGSVPDVLTKP